MTMAQINDKVAGEIIDFINKVGVTYPAEISREVMLKVEIVQAYLHHLAKDKKIYRLNPLPDIPPQILWKRIREFWAKGIKGKYMFEQMWLVVPACQLCGESKALYATEDITSKQTYYICKACYNKYKVD